MIFFKYLGNFWFPIIQLRLKNNIAAKMPLAQLILSENQYNMLVERFLRESQKCIR